jgi:unsaturated chondroitin disaccharide hydrolase
MYWASRRVKERRDLPFIEATSTAASVALEVAAGKVSRLVANHLDYFPLYTDHGRWKHGKEAWTNWCEGFLGGQMWLFYELGLGDEWKARAEHYSKLVEERQYDNQVHDLGFVLCPTWKKWWELTGDDPCRQVIIQGGRTMATRFNSKGKFLRSFLAPDSIFIDIMMNVGIIAVAGLETGDQGLVEVPSSTAKRLANTWYVAMDRPAMKVFLILIPESSYGRPPNRVGVAILPGLAGWPGRCMGSPPCTR